MGHQARKLAGIQHKGQGRSARRRRNVLGWAVVVALALLAAGSVGIAVAEEGPKVAIESPTQGALLFTPTPSFAGAANGSTNLVTLHIYEGSSESGTQVQELPATLAVGGGTWSVTPTLPLADGKYTAVAKQLNEASEAEATAPVTFTVHAAPVVTSSPQGTIVDAGEDATFTAEASSTLTTEVHWDVKRGASTWAPDTSDFGNNTDSLTVTTTPSENGYQYRAVFTNASGTAESEAATLTVDSAPVITASPASRRVTAGESATFTAKAAGTPAPTVRWEVTEPEGEWVPDTTDTGNTTTTLTVSNTTPEEDGNEYRAKFTNGIGEPATSNPATLTVITAPPVVTTQPASTTVTAGSPATFKATASGKPTPTVQWQFKATGSSEWTNDTTDSGNNLNTLTVVSTAAENGYQYRAAFQNGPANTVWSAPATLTVHSSPVVTTNPANTSVVAGETPTFTAAASGVPAPTVQWQVSTNGGSSWTVISGATSDTLTGPHATLAESGAEYQAIFTNTVGKASSTPATLTVAERKVAPLVTLNPVGAGVTAGESATFTAEASGTPTPRVEWQVSIDFGSHWANVSGATSTTLTITNTTAAENGYEYHAVFTNNAGKVISEAATLNVTEKVAPVVTVEPVSTNVKAGEDATFAAAASGVPTPTVHWQVSTDGGSTWTNDTSDSGDATDTLTVAGVQIWESGYEYKAVFESPAGLATSVAATLTVTTPQPLVDPPDPGPPVASFTWFPNSPHTGEAISLASNSTDAYSPITGVSWDVAGNGPFIAGASVRTTSFATPGGHAVRLRVVDANGFSSIATRTITVTRAPVSLMAPFPVVRIAGSEFSSGVMLSLLTVQAPLGARITVTCRGHGCPAKSEMRVAVSSGRKHQGGVVLVTFPRFERALRPGIVLVVRIWAAGKIGKYTSFTIRHQKLPVRVDACLSPSNSAIPCPS